MAIWPCEVGTWVAPMATRLSAVAWSSPMVRLTLPSSLATSTGAMHRAPMGLPQACMSLIALATSGWTLHLGPSKA